MFLIDLGLDFSTPTGIAVSIIGFVALIAFCSSFQVKNRRLLLILQTFSFTCFGIQYLLTGAYTGLILEAVCIFRNLLFYFKGNNKLLNSIYVPIFFGVSAIVIGICTFAGWPSMLPAFATVVQSFALYAKKEEHSRLLFLVGSPLWLVYNICSGLLFPVITECINMISIIISVIRFTIKSKKENK